MKTLTLLFAAMVAMAVTLSLNSCSSKKDNVTPVKPTLYDSLGGTVMVNDPAHSGTMIEKGRLGIRSVIDSTIFVIAADTRINGHFTVLLSEVTAGNLTGFTELSKNLTDFVAVGTGAKNYTYTGMDMTAAHDPAQNPRMNGKASSADFDAFVDDVVKGANKNGLPANLIGSLGKIIVSLKAQVVQK
ncbi:MAG: hypothetical protein ACTHMI_15955 [Mucilaginibacter sp.]